ncbi:hypothetical protein SBADM41S_10336 [Streptomyces badius]
MKAAAYRESSCSRPAGSSLFCSACLLTSGDVHLAEDLVQETLSRMYVTWGRARRIDNPAAYVQTVLVRTFLTHRRRRSASEHPLAELPEATSADRDDPALRMTLLRALSQLAPKDRAVVVLRYWEDRSIEETAAALRVSPAAVRTRCVRATRPAVRTPGRQHRGVRRPLT